MKLVASKILQVQLKTICVASLLLGSYNAYAAAYTYPTPGFSVPLTLSNSDTVTVNSGTVATASGNSTSFTINFSNATTTGVTITNAAGATLGYNGTNGAGSVISSTRNSTSPVNNLITNNGTISSNSKPYAFYVENITNGAAADEYIINNTGTINGAIFSSGVEKLSLNNSSNSTIVGPITLNNGGVITNNGSISTTNSDSGSYTIGFGGINSSDVEITNNAGATIGYNGTNGAGAAISSTRNTTVETTNLIDNSGIINSGTGLYAIYINNSTSGLPQDKYAILNTNLIQGAVLTSGIETVLLELRGTNANVIGTINLSAVTSELNLRDGVNFTPVEQLANIDIVRLNTAAIFNLNTLNSNMGQFIINSGTIVNVNYTLSGGAGSITNNGIMNIAANISKTGTFSGSGTNVVSDTVSISTSTYDVDNHTALMTDVSMYSNMTLSDDDTEFTSNNFNVAYGGGYLSGGTYTLVTAEGGIPSEPSGSMPVSTQFLTFNPPTRTNGNTQIQMVINRTPFNAFATNTMTQNIGANLEAIGSNNPTEDMVALLNAVEASTTPGATQAALQQLAPLSTAPLYGFEIQDTTMYQVELRLASLRDESHYYAGDIARDNHVWIRPFGTYANQKAKYDILGYYGSSGGFTLGFDRNLGDNYLVGASGGYVLSHIDDKINTQSTTKVQSYLGMIYGTYDITETSYLDWIFAIVANEFDASRFIDIDNYEQTATSSYNSQQFSVKGLWSKDYSAFDFMQLTPQASAQYTYAKQYSYSESGANGANLDISRTNSSVIQLALGGKVAVPVWLDPSIFIPELHATVFYNPIIGEQNTIFSFVEGGGQTTSFFNLNRTGLVYGGALTIAVVDKLEVKLNLDIDVQDRFSGYTAYLNLRYLL